MVHCQGRWAFDRRLTHVNHVLCAFVFSFFLTPKGPSAVQISTSTGWDGPISCAGLTTIGWFANLQVSLA
eukprot:SAG11_NODE_86_length_17300_cov_11.466717_23_plen_70_part_00